MVMAEITYSKPTWSDNTTPAMSAANLQALSDALDLAVHTANRTSAGKTLDADTMKGSDLFSACAQNIAFASGYGIDFSATADAGGMTSELLDDYEEGTWTPTVTSSGGGSPTQTAGGTYTKVGNSVNVRGYINLTAHTGSGTISITGLPFTSGSSGTNASPVTVYVSNLTLTAGNYLEAYINNNTTTITLSQVATGGGSAVTVPLDTAFTLMISAEYKV